MTAAGAPSPVPSPSEPPASGPDGRPGEAGGQPHNFEVQKQVHRTIRNDPDYDDWEYGTEPLPHEAWVARQGRPLDASGDAA